MDDNRLLNEAYNKKVVKEDYGDEPGNYRPVSSLPMNDMEEGFKGFCQDNGITPDHPSFRTIHVAYQEGFTDARNIYHEVEDDWETRY